MKQKSLLLIMQYCSQAEKILKINIYFKNCVNKSLNIVELTSFLNAKAQNRHLFYQMANYE